VEFIIFFSLALWNCTSNGLWSWILFIYSRLSTIYYKDKNKFSNRI